MPLNCFEFSMPFSLIRITLVATGILFVFAIIIIVFKSIFNNYDSGVEFSLFGDFL